VVGGGLAGITAAIDLAQAGHEVVLLEARPRLGGAASSYQRGEMTIDNGQHVILRCCDQYQALLARLGVTGQVKFQPRFDVTVLGPGGPARLFRTGLPSPLHLTASLTRYKLLPLADRLKVGRAALAMKFVDPADPATDDQRLGDWLAARGQSEKARRRMWDLFIISALNIAGDDANLSLAATVIKTALLGAKNAADIGVAAVPLGELHGTAPAGLLAKLGAQVKMSAKVAAIRPQPGGGFTLELTRGDSGEQEPADGDAVAEVSGPAAGGEMRHRPKGGDPLEPSLDVGAVVLAVPSAQASRLAGAAGVGGAAAWDGLGASPIVNVHVIYDRQVLDLPFVAAVDSPVQWVFDKTGIAGLKTGQYLAVSLSAADEFVTVPAAQLREQFLPELERLFPAARNAQVTDYFVTRERRATFRQAPGCGALRPSAGTSVPGLVLAGSWTDTGWPDTMEGAVRSGHYAAQHLIAELTDRPAAGLATSAATGDAATGRPTHKAAANRAVASSTGNPEGVAS
jgi:squalene-associated FAD-dependent desaturase